MRQNLPGTVIFLILWPLLSIAGWRLAPDACLLGAVGAGLFAALLVCLPGAILCGMVWRLFAR